MLYVRGKLKTEDIKSLAVVGTRKPTEYGIGITRDIVVGLVKNGLTIVSGLARGIDGVGHRQALDSGGRTIAVLGSAIDDIYPQEHRTLAERIFRQGALISIFGPGEPSFPGFFAVRNKFIVGLSLGILVTEGAKKSGTRITVNFAIDQDKPVFVIPGDISRPLSQGPVEMIKEGAQLVTGVDEILTTLDLKKVNGQRMSVDISSLKKKQRQVYEALLQGTLSMDELTRVTGISIADLEVELTLMEVEGLVNRVGDSYGVA